MTQPPTRDDLMESPVALAPGWFGQWRRLSGVPMVRKYVSLLPLVALLGTVSALLEGIGIGLLIPLVAFLMADNAPTSVPAALQSITAVAAQMDRSSQIFFLGGLFLALMVGKAVVQTTNRMLTGRIGTAFEMDLREELAGRALSLPYSQVVAEEPSRLTKLLDFDCWNAAHSARAALALPPAYASLTVFAVVLAWLDWRLFLIVVAGALVLEGLLKLAHRWQERLSLATVSEYQSVAFVVLSIVTAARAIRVFDQQLRERSRISAALKKLRSRLTAKTDVEAAIEPFAELMVAVLFIVVLLSSYLLGITVPKAIAFLVLMVRAQPNAQIVNRSRVAISAQRGSIEEVAWLLAQKPAAPPASTLEDPGAIDAEIRFDSVGYTYPNGTRGLSDVTATIRPGIATALIGQSGSGKTTLVNLLSRLLEPDSGAILLGRRPIREFDPRLWRERIAIAGQDIDLVATSVAENISYGRRDATPEEIEEIARVAGADTFIRLLPQGYDTFVGHGGLNLSGGQRQRIGLARALLKRPDLLILDEATSAVDALAESEIMVLLREHRFFRTAVVISHRRSTLALCQEGIVMDGGRIVEAGPLSELRYYEAMLGGTQDP